MFNGKARQIALEEIDRGAAFQREALLSSERERDFH
jgi:hypothetical protein